MFNIVNYVQTIQKLLGRRDVLIIAVLILAYFLTRLINLDKFPIFSDEGIYIRWAKVAWHDANWRFISLTDGRQPFQTWGTIPFLKLFPDNALLAGRLFSVATGFFGLSGIFLLGWYTLGRKVAYVASALYITVPYFLFYDRMALADSGVTAFAVWILLLSIVLVQTVRLDVALIFGLVAGMGMLTKSSMRLYLGLAFFASLYIFMGALSAGVTGMWARLRDTFGLGRQVKKNKRTLTSFINFTVLYGLSLFIAFVIYNVQRLSPFFHNVAEKNKTFALTMGDFLADPTAFLFLNLKRMPYFIASEMGYVVAIFGLIGLGMLMRRKRWLGIYFSLWLLIPYVVLSAFAIVLYPRYVLPLGAVLLIPAAYFLVSLRSRTHRISATGLIVASVFFFNYAILFAPLQTPFPQVDRGQYLEGWPAGIGAREIMEYARQKSQEQPVIILAEGNFGMSHDVLDVFKKDGDEIHIHGLWPLDLEHLNEYQAKLVDHHIFIVFSHRSDFPDAWPMRMIEKYDKPGNESNLYLFELLPPTLQESS